MDKITCAFCNREFESIELIRAPGKRYVCKQCAFSISNVYEALMDDEEDYDVDTETSDNNKEEATQDIKDYTPVKIKEELDKFVIGQDRAKKTLSISSYNAIKRNKIFEETGKCNIAKSNILLIGDTGVGKTYTTETLADILGVPFVSVDITSFSQTGYEGHNVEDIIRSLWLVSETKEEAEHGIVLIDEIDKLVRGQKGDDGTLSTVGVQRSLLKLIEGTDVELTFGTRNYSEDNSVVINTKNILFIGAGSFVGLKDIIRKRKNKDKSKMGFGSSLKDKDEQDILIDVLPEDLFEFGFIPEFVGRFPIITPLDSLSEEDIKDIVIKPENSILKQYQQLFEMDGIELTIEDDALSEIAKQCLRNKTGARGLRNVFDRILLEPSFELPSQTPKISKCIITKESVIGTKKPTYISEKTKKTKKVGKKS